MEGISRLPSFYYMVFCTCSSGERPATAESPSHDAARHLDLAYGSKVFPLTCVLL